MCLEGLEKLPESSILRIELGRLYIDFEAWDDATQVLERARELDPAVEGTVDVLLARIDDALRRRDAVIIPISSSRSLKATCMIDGRKQQEFIVDTGATYTAIPADTATQLGYDLRDAPRVTVRTANGLIAVPRIRLQSVSLEGYSVRNLTALALPTNLGPRSGLLGLNFLNHFRFSVDAQRGEFRLERP